MSDKSEALRLADALEGIDFGGSLKNRYANDGAAELRRLHASNKRMREALLDVARRCEALKQECGENPESPQAIRNGRYMSISYAARAALETK